MFIVYIGNYVTMIISTSDHVTKDKVLLYNDENILFFIARTHVIKIRCCFQQNNGHHGDQETEHHLFVLGRKVNVVYF